MPSIRESLERRNALRGEMQQIHTAHPNGDLPADAQSRWSAAETELRSVDAFIARQALIDDHARQATGQPLTENRAQGDIPRGFNVARLLGHAAGLRQDGAAEMDFARSYARSENRSSEGVIIPLSALVSERRTMTTTSPVAGPGGNLLATDLAAPVDALREALILPQLGATVLTGLRNQLDIPVVTTPAEAVFVPENNAVPVVDIPTGKVQLRPRTAGVIVELGRNLLLQDSPDVAAFVQQHLLRAAVRGIQRAALVGSGQNGEPVGILNTPGIGSVSYSAETSSALLSTTADLLGEIDDANALSSPIAFVSNSKVRRAAAHSLDTMGRPLGLATIFQNQPTLFTNAVPHNLGTNSNASAIIAGAWEHLVIGVWAAGEILVNPYATDAYARGAVQIRLLVNVDVAVTHPAAFAAATDVTV